MSFEHLTDAEVAVVIDSLAQVRRELASKNIPSPNVDNAIAKLAGLMSPTIDGLYVSTESPDGTFSQPERKELAEILEAESGRRHAIGSLTHSTDAERQLWHRNAELLGRLAAEVRR